jgi:hypothetical protein
VVTAVHIGHRGLVPKLSSSSSSVVVALITSECRSGLSPSLRDQGEIYTRGKASSMLSVSGSGPVSRCIAGRSAAWPSPRSATT